MKAVVERAALVRAMGEAARVVQTRNTIPILANVKIEADAEGLRLTATDLDLQITVPVAARVEASGATTAPAHRLASIVASLPEGCQISLELGDGRLTVKAARSRFVLPVLPVDQFPVLAPPEDGAAFTLSAADLRRLFGQPQPAVSTEEVRYYLNGICLEVDSERAFLARPSLIATATDGQRLLRASVPLPHKKLTLEQRPIVPKRATELVARLAEAGDAKAEIDLQISGTMATARFGGTVIVSKLIEGNFPDADRVIRRSAPISATVDPDALVAAVKRVQQVAEGKARIVKMAFAPEMLTVSCRSAEYGEAIEEMPAILTDATAFEIFFDAVLGLPMLERFAGAELDLGFDSPAGPIVMRKPGGGEDFVGVLMPCRG